MAKNEEKTQEQIGVTELEAIVKSLRKEVESLKSGKEKDFSDSDKGFVPANHFTERREYVIPRIGKKKTMTFSINGYDFTVQLGKKVMLPVEVIELYESSRAQDERTRNMLDSLVEKTTDL